MPCGCGGGPPPPSVAAMRIERQWRCGVHAVAVTRSVNSARWWCRRGKHALGPADVYRADGGPIPQTDDEACAMEKGEWPT